MKKQPSSQSTYKPPERSCKVIKKHSCVEHTQTRNRTETNRNDTDKGDKRPKSGNSIKQNFCPCNPCLCENCPDILLLMNRTFSKKGIGLEAYEDIDFGLCPKSPDAKPASCSTTCTEVLPPKPIKLDMITYDDECTCELIARAIRADVHRYLTLVDRTPKPNPKSKDCPKCVAKRMPRPNPKSDFKDYPESEAKSIPKLKTKSDFKDCCQAKSDFKGCPECLNESIPNSKPRSKIRFCDSDIDPNVPCLQPDAKL